jgi:hypothetical protein
MAANPPEPDSATPAASPPPPPPPVTPAPATATVPAKTAPPAPSASTTGATPRPAAPAAAPAAPRSGGGNGSLVLLSLVSVLIALAASAVAVYSLDQARQATSRANEALDTAKRAAAPAKAPAAVPTTAKPTPTVSKGPAFVAELVRSQLKVPAVASPCASVYVDIDKMAVGDQSGHEFYSSNCVGPLSLHVDRTAGAVPTTTNPTPELCASQITAETATTELIMPVINGLTFCLLTNKADAAQQSLPQRLAIVEVAGVGPDNSIQLVVSTWRVPAP